MTDNPERDNPDQKSTDFDDLPPGKKDQSGIKGGATAPPVVKTACSSGLLSTCNVQDTTVTMCDTLSGCTTGRR